MISDSKLSVGDQQVILHKARQRLSGWKMSCLSQAGRVVLIQSVLQALPVHIFLSGWSSVSIIKKLESLNRAFLWNSSAGHRCMPLLNWAKVTSSRMQGGKDLAIFYTSILGSAIFKSLSHSDTPWVRLTRLKYGRLSIGSKTAKSSFTWRSLVRAFPRLVSGFIMVIGTGYSCNVLEDHWVTDLPLAWKLTFINMDLICPELTVSSFILNGAWNLELLQNYFGSLLIQRILAIPISLLPDDDKWVWSASTSGSPKCGSLYRHLS